jgi:hypothetical protein
MKERVAREFVTFVWGHKRRVQSVDSDTGRDAEYRRKLNFRYYRYFEDKAGWEHSAFLLPLHAESASTSMINMLAVQGMSDASLGIHMQDSSRQPEALGLILRE